MIKYVKPLPVTEETIGAYLEGNLSAEEISHIENLMNSNNVFKDFVDEVSVEDINIDETIYDAYPNFDLDFELPEVPLQFELQQDMTFPNPAIELESPEPELVACARCAEEDIFNNDEGPTLADFEEVATSEMDNSSNDVNEESDFINSNTEL